jgi:PPM family protein phosphatase
MKLETWSDSNIGRIRKTNQDTVGCFPDLQLFMVADGMGGRAEGERASRMAVDLIRDYLGREATATELPAKRRGFWSLLFGRDDGRPPVGPDESAETRLRDAVALANRQIYEAGQAQELGGPDQSMGTTVVILDCALAEQRAHWAHVGDSRLYRVRNGEMELLTADHTLIGEAFWDKQRIPSDLPHTNRLVRALGIRSEVEASVGSEALRVGDLFLLCSDGVSGMLKAEVLQEGLLSGRDLPEMGNSLIELALEAGGRDNATALLVKVIDE